MENKRTSKLIACILTLTLLLSISITSSLAVSSTYSDMPSDWRGAPIQYAVDNGLLVGLNGKIDPNGYLTRAQMAAIIARAFGSTQLGDISSFKDVPAKAWYHDYVAIAYKMEVLLGGINLMTPESNITREQAFAILARALKLTTTDYSSLDKFTDKNKINNMFKGELAALAQANYINGSGGILNPTDNITRAQFAKVLQNMIKSYISKAGTYTSVNTGTLMVKASGVILKDVTVSGDLIIGDGVGTGDVTLDNAKVTGRTIVRGGGVNSIHVINGSSLTGTVIIDNVNNEVRIVTDSGTVIQKIEAGSEVVLEGTFGTVQVVGNNTTSVTIKGQATNVVMDAAGATLNVLGTVTNVQTTTNASNAVLNVAAGGKVTNVTAGGAGTQITGAGTVTTVNANANNVSVKTSNTIVQAAQGVTGVTAGGQAVAGGSTVNSTLPSGGGSPSGGTVYPVSSVAFIKSDASTIGSTSSGSDYTIDISSQSGVITGFKVNCTPSADKLVFNGFTNPVLGTNGTFSFSGNNSLIQALTGVDIHGDVNISTIQSILSGSMENSVQVYSGSTLVTTINLIIKIDNSGDEVSSTDRILNSFDINVNTSTGAITASVKTGHSSDKIFTNTGFYTLMKAIVTVPAGYSYDGIQISGDNGNTYTALTKTDLTIATDLTSVVGKALNQITLGDLSGLMVKVQAAQGATTVIKTVTFN